MKHVLGIDFGTHKTVIAKIPLGVQELHEEPEIIRVDDKPEVRSVVQLTSVDETNCIGNQAWDQAIESIDNTYTNFKPFLGTSDPCRGIGGKAGPDALKLSVAFLTRLRTYLEEYHFNHTGLANAVDRILYGIPAHWQAEQKACLQEAFRKAGFPNPNGVAEPLANLAAFRSLNLVKGKGDYFLLVDAGSSGTTVSLLRAKQDKGGVVSSQHVVQLGGMCFDDLIHRHLLKTISDQGKPVSGESRIEVGIQCPLLKAQFAEETAKGKDNASLIHRLENHEKMELKITEQEMSALCKTWPTTLSSILNRVLRNGNISWKNVDTVLVTGGSTRLPLILEMIRKTAPKKPIVHAAHPSVTLAQGIALAALSVQRKIPILSESLRVKKPIQPTKKNTTELHETVARMLDRKRPWFAWAIRYSLLFVILFLAVGGGVWAYFRKHPNPIEITKVFSTQSNQTEEDYFNRIVQTAKQIDKAIFIQGSHTAFRDSQEDLKRIVQECKTKKFGKASNSARELLDLCLRLESAEMRDQLITKKGKAINWPDKLVVIPSSSSNQVVEAKLDSKPIQLSTLVHQLYQWQHKFNQDTKTKHFDVYKVSLKVLGVDMSDASNDNSLGPGQPRNIYGTHILELGGPDCYVVFSTRGLVFPLLPVCQDNTSPKWNNPVAHTLYLPQGTGSVVLVDADTNAMDDLLDSYQIRIPGQKETSIKGHSGSTLHIEFSIEAPSAK